MLNCLAIDDERFSLDLLADNISKVSWLNLVAKCRNAVEAIAVMEEQKIDLIFLDIQMPGLNSLQFVQSLPNPPMVIFVTAYKEYAFDGFNLNAIDYLLKPVSFERFLKACNKANDLYRLTHASKTEEEKPGYFFVYVEYNLVKITVADIVYIEGMKDYVKIVLTTSPRPVITKMSMKAMEDKLQPYRFVRIHKSYIVSTAKLTAIKRDVVAIANVELPLSDTYKPGLEKMLPR